MMTWCKLKLKLTTEQRDVYDKVLTVASSTTSGLFFVYGYGGTGKTFVCRTLSAALWSQRKIVLNVALSGIASLLMSGGPLDRTMLDLLQFTNPLNSTLPFGGKIVVLGGDFHQILPVIPKGTRQDIVGATINSSYLWAHCTVLWLTKNLRLHSVGAEDEMRELSTFANWIASIGDGQAGGPNDGHVEVPIPPENLLQTNRDPIQVIVESTFLLFQEQQHDADYLIGRAILAPTLEVVDEVNDYMSNLNVAECRTYFSSDSVCPTESTLDVVAGLHTLELLNGLKCSRLPNHCLNLKIGSPVMLLRNIDQVTYYKISRPCC
ncbi:PREDICTED: uncharacterized protein LOC109191566 [Ipomoea nil]|uniref:uncharacterized protein LOC109191566 n=1 Tax=Ipomoea nil TaxID=35883 RepID=UPI000900C02F|nr:PREDICTED: uncharacterized protein LOC109191566 [Ipomoea nil]